MKDGLDQCPSSPPGDKVDANGCSLDTDKDTVRDAMNNAHVFGVAADQMQISSPSTKSCTAQGSSRVGVMVVSSRKRRRVSQRECFT